MKNKRVNQISEEIRRDISDIVQYKVKDPRIPEIISISKVEVTNDLSYAKVYVSILANEDEKLEAIEALKNAKGFIKRELAKKVKLRVMPELLFNLDESIEINLKMEKLIDEVINGDN